MTDYKAAIQGLYEIEKYWLSLGNKELSTLDNTKKIVMEIARYTELQEINKNLDRIATALEDKGKESNDNRNE